MALDSHFKALKKKKKSIQEGAHICCSHHLGKLTLDAFPWKTTVSALNTDERQDSYLDVINYSVELLS